MNGPQHYLAAEGALASAQHWRDHVESKPLIHAIQPKEARERAELDLKAAHVHAMLAVAGSNVLIAQLTADPQSKVTEPEKAWSDVAVTPEVTK